MDNFIDYLDWFPKRVTELRLQKGVSARDMSLSLGQSESYINKIENKRTLPSMSGFFYICEFFGITPQEFFDLESQAPQKATTIMNEFKHLTPLQADHILQVIQDITQAE